MNKCKEYNLDVYKPVFNHLYNTVLITTHHCNLQLIYDLSMDNIYIGSTSACLGDSKYIDPNVRISFINGKNNDDKLITKIIEKIRESNDEAIENP